MAHIIEIPLQELEVNNDPVEFSSSNPAASFSAYFQGRQRGLNWLADKTVINLDELSAMVLRVASGPNSGVFRGSYILGLLSVIPVVKSKETPKVGGGDG